MEFALPGEYSGAPLVCDDKVIVQTGSKTGSLIALNIQTGDEIWRGGSAEAGYAGPYLRKSNHNEIVVFNQAGLSIHDLLNGRKKSLISIVQDMKSMPPNHLI